MATYGNEVISVGGHKKTQTYGTVHAFRSTGQNLPPRTRCAQGGPNFQIGVPKVGLIFKFQTISSGTQTEEMNMFFLCFIIFEF